MQEPRPDAWNEVPKVLIAYPSKGSAYGTSERWSDVLHEIRAANPNATTLSSSGFPWDVARNHCALTCMEKGFDYLFFIDQDVIPPKDVLQRLISHQVQIAGGIYRQKFAPHNWCIFKAVKTQNGIDDKIPVAPTGGLIPVDYIGAGCLLIHRRVFELLPFPWFRWTLTPDNPSGRSEDFYFSDLCRDNGIKIFADTSILCGHVCTTLLTEKGFEMMW